MKRLKPKSEFSKNVLTLMTGTTIAQAIPIAISPILTRIYTPEDFGVFALYVAIASILSVIATGRYEMAIMLPKKDEDAVNIVALSIIISFFVSFISLVIVFIFNAKITNILGNPEISNWLYFIPITVLLTGVYQSFNYWSNRKKQYKRLAISRVVQSGSTATTNLGMGFGQMGSSGLILGQVLGLSIAVTILGRMIWEEDKNRLYSIKLLKIFAITRRYIKFPKFDILASFLNVSSHQITHILFNTLFNSTIAGYYYFTQKILGLPITFIASAISDVFRQIATIEYQQLGNAKKIYKSTFKKLFILSLFPSFILYFYSVELFVFVFGEQWSASGEYAKILVPMLFLRFISSPLSFMLYVGQKQHWNMYAQILFLTAIGASFTIGDSAHEVIYLISIQFSCIYIFYLYMSAKIAKLF
ncbi:oligosaccharide flippase family protein [Sulfurimonas sp.]|uniref:lipopolysaccharide biosynthesis protein n=1 Tax=Sulfurimonas sp. TaxID=2022749 RepID=UPI0025E97DB5|nr:oligosaccharide flippase family protein [Sulfurimonas sp.]MCK9472257.1 oligosaccharide flippase family protein [Sulfurimonas sp.]